MTEFTRRKITTPLLTNKATTNRRAFATGVLTASLAVMSLAAPAHSQNQPDGGTAAPVAASQNAEYRVAPEDVLSITVQNQPDLSREIQVLQDGTIDLPYAGQIKVVGLTIKELKDTVTKRLSKTFVRPQVNVSVRGRQVKQINVIGAVKSPGKIALREGWRLLDVVAAAGIESDRFEFYRASLLRNRTNEVVPIDLQKLIGDKDPAVNLPVEADDTVSITRVDEAETFVQVVGQVVDPGPKVLPRNGSIIDVLQAAKGPTPSARLSQVTLERRDGQKIIIDMRDYQKTGFEPTEKLRVGDRLIVPENKLRLNVYGAVGRAGELPYPDDRKLTVYSAIAYAGGQTNGAELKKTRLTRTQPDGKTTTRVVNVEKMLKTGDLSEDTPVEPGDSIYVPASAGRRGLDPLSLIGVVGAIPVLYGIFTGRVFR